MSLELGDVAGYLLDRRLVKPRAVVEGEFRIEDVSRLNRVFLVSARPGRGYVLKVADPTDPGRIVREGAVLERLHAADKDGTLGHRLPRLVDLDRERGVLILEAAADARDLDHCQPAGRYSRTLARECGRALAALHRLPPDVTAGLETTADPTEWLRLEDLDLTRLRSLSGAGAHVVRSIQSLDGLAGELAALLAERAPETTVHGDVRWGNCLAVPAEGRSRRTRVRLIDWEFATAGDPAADVGAFFGEYLRVWLAGYSAVTPAAAELSAAQLKRVAPPVAAFWRAYAAQRGSGPAALGRLLRRAVCFAGARLIASAIEEAQLHGQPVRGLDDVVRVGAQILRRPDEAGVHLLGLRPAWAS